MGNKISRNDPCPCGSGKKYKKCCMQNMQKKTEKQGLTPNYQFEPGSYGDTGGFVPSIACLKQIKPNEWQYHFVLVKPIEVYVEKEKAESVAESDLNIGFIKKEQKNSDHALADHLKAQGYIKVSDFDIVSGSNHKL